MRSALAAGRRARVVLAGAVVVTAVALLGPRERFEERWREPELPADLDAHLAESEAAVPRLRPEAAKGIAWADPEARGRTGLALVYLHGFSADRHEVEPLVSILAGALGANAYFARLRGHGRDGDAMAEATVEGWFDDAAEAMAIGRRIGERVVLIGTSTGATLATWAASRDEVDGALAALVLISPNFQPRDRASRVLLWPWGGAIARVVAGPERCFQPVDEAQAAHWTTCYPISALLPMMALAEHVRTMDLTGVDVPTLAIFSPDDQVVDPAETARVIGGVGAVSVRLAPYRGSDDPEQHVLAGDIASPGSTAAVADTILTFLRGELGVAAGSGTGAPPGRAPPPTLP